MSTENYEFDPIKPFAKMLLCLSPLHFGLSMLRFVLCMCYHQDFKEALSWIFAPKYQNFQPRRSNLRMWPQTTSTALIQTAIFYVQNHTSYILCPASSDLEGRIWGYPASIEVTEDFWIQKWPWKIHPLMNYITPKLNSISLLYS